LWVRIAAGAFLIASLLSMLLPRVLNPTWTEGVPADQLPSAFGFITLGLLLVWCVARSRIEVSGDEVLIVNPWGTKKLSKADIVRVEPGPFGVDFRTEEQRIVGFAVQATAVFTGDRPRWVDIAEVLTGRTPDWQATDYGD
jgi:hypothetical protein